MTNGEITMNKLFEAGKACLTPEGFTRWLRLRADIMLKHVGCPPSPLIAYFDGWVKETRKLSTNPEVLTECAAALAQIAQQESHT